MEVSRRNAGVHRFAPGGLEFSRFDRRGVPLLGGGLEFANARAKPLLQGADRHRKSVPTEGALPNDGNSPTCFEELALRTVVPLDITLEFGLPKVGPSGRRGCVTAPRMAMPETAVNKADRTMATQDKIGFSGEIPYMESESESASVKRPSEGEFRFGVLARYARHHSRPCGLVDNVSHRMLRSPVRSLRNPDFTRGQPQDQASTGSMGNGDGSGAGLGFLRGIQPLRDGRNRRRTHELSDLGVRPRLARLVRRSTNEGATRYQ